MKKILYILPAVVLALTACNREEKNFFDETAAERLIKGRQQAFNYLTNAESWEMRYFTTPESAGYALLCQFNADGSVKVGAKNAVSSSNLYKTEVSLWDIDYTQSLTLSFKSYNTLLTIFADPLGDGVGYGGDYEFVILSASPDYLKLKGKKTGSYIDLYRLEDVEWPAYYEQIDAFNELTFTGNEEAEFTYIGYDTVLTMTYADGAFTYTRNDADTTLGFVVTPSGVHFYSETPNTLGLRAKDFIISADTSKLVCDQDEAIYFVSNYTPADFFASKFNQDARWTYREEGSDADTRQAVNELKALAQAKGATITRIAYSRLATLNSSGKRKYSYILLVDYTVENKLFQGYLNLNYSNSNGVIKFSFKSVDASIEPLLLRIADTKEAGAKAFTDIFCDSFTPASYSGSKLNMVEMTLTSTTDAQKVIHVVGDTKSR